MVLVSIRFVFERVKSNSCGNEGNGAQIINFGKTTAKGMGVQDRVYRVLR